MALAFFKQKELEKFHELALSSELDPREVMFSDFQSRNKKVAF